MTKYDVNKNNIKASKYTTRLVYILYIQDIQIDVLCLYIILKWRGRSAEAKVETFEELTRLACSVHNNMYIYMYNTPASPTNPPPRYPPRKQRRRALGAMFFSDSKPTPRPRHTAAARVPMGTAAPGDIGPCGVGAAVVAGGAKECDGGGCGRRRRRRQGRARARTRAYTVRALQRRRIPRRRNSKPPRGGVDFTLSSPQNGWRCARLCVRVCTPTPCSLHPQSYNMYNVYVSKVHPVTRSCS